MKRDDKPFRERKSKDSTLSKPLPDCIFGEKERVNTRKWIMKNTISTKGFLQKEEEKEKKKKPRYSNPLPFLDSFKKRFSFFPSPRMKGCSGCFFFFFSSSVLVGGFCGCWFDWRTFSVLRTNFEKRKKAAKNQLYTKV